MSTPTRSASFPLWFGQALEAGVTEANAMSVATVGADGRPSSRILLIKDVDADGFTWFTNYASRKGRELAIHPYAALLFLWVELERQVRVEGRVEKLPDAQSDAYFQSRPLKSRLARSPPNRASRSPAVRRWSSVRGSGSGTRRGSRHGRRTGAATGWCRTGSSSGRAGRRACTTAFVYTRQEDGGWRRERLQP